MNRYWFRSYVGLEKILLEEINEKYVVASSEINHRSVFVQIKDSEKITSNFKDIKIADDVYQVLGKFVGISNTKDSMHGFITYFKNNIIPLIKDRNNKYVRVTVSFLGKRNFSRFDVEQGINQFFKEDSLFKVLDNKNGDTWEEDELRIRCHIENDVVIIGVALADKPLHRRSWRTAKYIAQLHPPVAAAMLRLARVKPSTALLDPFCGSGTILIEAISENNLIKLVGWDIEPETILIAKQNLKNTSIINTNIDFQVKDAFNQDVIKGFNLIISNPPWGEKHNIESSSVFLSNLVNLVSKVDKAILIMPEVLIDDFKRNFDLEIHELIFTRVKGFAAYIVSIEKNKL
jgi:tRNA (guanine6-N2)-methyltransferase